MCLEHLQGHKNTFITHAHTCTHYKYMHFWWWVGQMRTKEMTNQYAEERRWVSTFNFDLEENEDTCWSHHPTAHKLTVSQSACWVILATELWCGLHTYTWSVCMCLHTRGILVSSFWLEKSQGDTKPSMQWLPIGVVTHVHPCSIWLSRAGAHAQCYQLPLHCWLRFAWFWGWSHCQTPMINHWTSPFVL